MALHLQHRRRLLAFFLAEPAAGRIFAAALGVVLVGHGKALGKMKAVFRHRRDHILCVRVQRMLQKFLRRGVLHLVGSVHDGDAVADLPGKIQVMGHTEHSLVFQAVESIHHHLDALLIQSLGRLIRQDHISSRDDTHGDHGTLLHAAAVGEGILSGHLFLVTDVKTLHQLYRLGDGFFFSNLLMLDHGFRHLKTNGQKRIQAVSASLGHIGNSGSADLVQLAALHPDHVLPLEKGLACDDGIFRKEMEDCQKENTFSTSGFTDDADFFFFIHRQAHIFHCLNPMAGGKTHGHIFYVKKHLTLLPS